MRARRNLESPAQERRSNLWQLLDNSFSSFIRLLLIINLFNINLIEQMRSQLKHILNLSTHMCEFLYRSIACICDNRHIAFNVKLFLHSLPGICFCDKTLLQIAHMAASGTWHITYNPSVLKSISLWVSNGTMV
jgi:hypothetical protein